jgi:hypothetical protein
MLLSTETINDELLLISDKYGKDIIYSLTDLFLYENDAIERDEFYMSNSTEKLTYEDWLKTKDIVNEENIEPIILTKNTYFENYKEYTSQKITYLEENEVFVFGSNPLGINGNPEKYPNMSASVATANGWVEQGEIMDNRLSNCGKAWGITTVTSPGAKLSKTPNEIGKGIQDMVLYAKKHPHLKFLVTKFGTENAGHSIDTIKGLFEKLKKFIPDNVILPKEFEVRD